MTDCSVDMTDDNNNYNNNNNNIYSFVYSTNEVETNHTRGGGDIHVASDLLSSVIDKREYVEVHRDCFMNSSNTSAEHDGHKWSKQSSDNGRCVSEDFEFL